MEDLSSLAELYSIASDHSALEKTSREMEDIEEEFAKAQECFQEYLHAVKDELSSQASEFSGKLLGAGKPYSWLVLTLQSISCYI